MKDPKQIESIHPVTGRLVVETLNDEPSMTQQQFADECDINNIMKKYERTGEFQHVTSKIGQYADFSGIQNYQEMLHTVQYAQDAFHTLPAKVRLEFKNDPGKLLEFLQDRKNYDKAVEMGLVEKPQTQSVPVNDDKTTTTDSNANVKIP